MVMKLETRERQALWNSAANTGECGCEIVGNYILSRLGKFLLNSLKFALRTGWWDCEISVVLMKKIKNKK